MPHTDWLELRVVHRVGDSLEASLAQSDSLPARKLQRLGSIPQAMEAELPVRRVVRRVMRESMDMRHSAVEAVHDVWCVAAFCSR